MAGPQAREAAGAVRRRLPRGGGRRDGVLRLVGRRQGLRARRGHGPRAVGLHHGRGSAPGAERVAGAGVLRLGRRVGLLRLRRGGAARLEVPGRARGQAVDWPRPDDRGSAAAGGRRGGWRRGLLRVWHLPERRGGPSRGGRGDGQAAVAQRHVRRCLPADAARRHGGVHGGVAAGLPARVARAGLRAVRPRRPCGVQSQGRQAALLAGLDSPRGRHLGAAGRRRALLGVAQAPAALRDGPTLRSRPAEAGGRHAAQLRLAAPDGPGCQHGQRPVRRLPLRADRRHPRGLVRSAGRHHLRVRPQGICAPRSARERDQQGAHGPLLALLPPQPRPQGAHAEAEADGRAEGAAQRGGSGRSRQGRRGARDRRREASRARDRNAIGQGADRLARQVAVPDRLRGRAHPGRRRALRRRRGEGLRHRGGFGQARVDRRDRRHGPGTGRGRRAARRERWGRHDRLLRPGRSAFAPPRQAVGRRLALPRRRLDGGLCQVGGRDRRARRGQAWLLPGLRVRRGPSAL